MRRRQWTAQDLEERARRAMREAGFPAGVPDVVRAAARRAAALPVQQSPAPDLRGLLWSSIDNDDSQDLDQLEYCERDARGYRVMVAIADVDAAVKRGDRVDGYAGEMTTSVYTGVLTFPMLPEELSHGATSLLPGCDRRAIVVDMRVSPDGEAALGGVRSALVRNRAKLVYEEVGAWLEGGAPPPPGVADTEGLEEQLRLQSEIAAALMAARDRRGMLDLRTIEARPVIADGRVAALRQTTRNPARDIIESFMVAANTCIAGHLCESGLPCLQRVVTEPRRWDRIRELASRAGDFLPDKPDARALSAFLKRRKAEDPVRYPDLSLAVVKLLGNGEYAVVRPGDGAGHFGLALKSYTHSTAPNRRYPDLIIQRQLKSLMDGARPPYTSGEMERLAQHCTEREDTASKVERLLRKCAAATMLQDRIGEVFEGIVTGASPKGTYARVFEPPFEGRVVRGERGLDVGDRVRLKLLEADPETGFIDFAAA